mmetsp:Transcript_21694/g.50068  ORF Transcript_21694/g.50068 Transcript_21694/m.50068 type:complete len:105 (-) Transcript_21694:1040-1354(-)
MSIVGSTYNSFVFVVLPKKCENGDNENHCRCCVLLCVLFCASLMTGAYSCRLAFSSFSRFATQDCCAATDPSNHDAIISMTKKQGGVFGAVSDSKKLIAALSSS